MQKVAIPGDENCRKAAILVFLFGALLRVALALVNLEANDNYGSPGIPVVGHEVL